MRDGKALTNMEEFAGKAYKAGDRIPASALANINPRALKALVDNYKIEIEGMEPSGGATGGGGQAHLTARLDQQGDQIKTLVAAGKAMNERLIALEKGKSVAPASRRAATAAKTKE